MSFKSLGLKETLLKAIDKKGYTTPSPIQEKAILPILAGKDVLASAQTGTGKTAGFTLPMLQILSEETPMRKRPIRALIVTPTRELAAQILANVKEYSEFMDMKSYVIFGGVKQNPQVSALRQGIDILVATPGRLLDLHNQKLLSLHKVEFLVLDEADRMLDMGFLHDIRKIVNIVPKNRQTLLFSATFSKEIKRLAYDFMQNPVLVEATPENSTVESIAQKAYHVSKETKTNLVIKLISEGDWEQVLIFTRTKHGANNLCKKLIAKGINSAAIHGNKSQNQRTKALAGFKDRTIRVLVATDIAARGLDIPLLPHVINFEIPNISEDYVHRIGRTGRAGASGEAVSLVSNDELDYFKNIEKFTKQKISIEQLEGFEPPKFDPVEIARQKKEHGGNQNRRGGGKKKWGNKNNSRKSGGGNRNSGGRR